MTLETGVRRDGTRNTVWGTRQCAQPKTRPLYGAYTPWRVASGVCGRLSPLGMRHTALCLSGSAKTQAVYAYAIVRPAP